MTSKNLCICSYVRLSIDVGNFLITNNSFLFEILPRTLFVATKNICGVSLLLIPGDRCQNEVVYQRDPVGSLVSRRFLLCGEVALATASADQRIQFLLDKLSVQVVGGVLCSIFFINNICHIIVIINDSPCRV